MLGVALHVAKSDDETMNEERGTSNGQQDARA